MSLLLTGVLTIVGSMMGVVVGPMIICFMTVARYLHWDSSKTRDRVVRISNRRSV